MTDTPTAERILKAFAGVSLTIIKHTAGAEVLRRLTPLAALQEDILQRLGLGTALYGQLALVQFDGNRQVSGICGQTGIRQSYYHRPNAPCDEVDDREL